MNNIRIATLEDIPKISFIHARTWKKAYKGYISQEYLDNITDDRWVLPFTKALSENIHEAAIISTDDGKDTGCITYGKARIGASCLGNDSCGNCCDTCGEIYSLYVLPEYWSTQQGYRLTNFALNRLHLKGMRQCYIWVLKDNVRAKRFYERYGFKNLNVTANFLLNELKLTEEKYFIRL
jgi:GNAT superfamily N-acetyltransferase